jgi:EAL domain-containing protein (putative c-di-GMP-specific phosphodiesterase class I)/ActR/RegA family two-component response regulator
MTGSISELKVLVVDDNKFMISLVKRILDKLGVGGSLEAQDGATALERLDEAEVDVIICDLNMPGMDGIEFLRHLAGRETQPAVVLLSGEDRGVLNTAAQLGKAHGLEILGAVAKPVTLDPLRELLAKVERGGSRGGRGTFEMLTPEEIRAGLDNDAIELMFQPKVLVPSRQMMGVEVFLRWRDPERGLMGPGAVVPVAEECGLINEITEAVIHKALAQCGIWRAEGYDFKVAINVSMQDLNRYEFPEFVIGTAEAEGVDPSSIMLEVTESRLMEDIVKPLEILTRLRMKGVGLSIDDYGTGASSMQQLRRIPFTELKIDREFVAGAPQDAAARAMLVSSVSLGKDLQLPVVAEGVEDEDEWALVASLGVDIVQGYYIAKPMDAQGIENWVVNWSAAE